MQRVVREGELRSALASSVLAPSTLVWREGMSGWVPAFTVPELGATDSQILPAEPTNEGTTDIAPAPKIGQPPGEISELKGYAPVPPPPLVVGGKVPATPPDIGSTADTGRPTPTELLNDKGQPQRSNGAPRPAAGQPAIATPMAKPVIPAARPLGKQDPTANAAKNASPRPSTAVMGGGVGKKNEGAKSKEEVTLVADASEPFKIKGPGDSPSNSASAAPAKEPSRVAQSLQSKRPVTRTALLDSNAPGNAGAKHEAPRPAAGRSPSTVPPPGGRSSSTAPPPAQVMRRPASIVPPPPVRVGPPRSQTPNPNRAVTPAPGALGNAADIAPKNFRTTAFMGSNSGSSPPNAGTAAANVSLPAAPRVPKPSGFAIQENTSTDSTGVLPLSTHFSAEPTVEPRDRLPSFSDPQEALAAVAQASGVAQPGAAHAGAKASHGASPSVAGAESASNPGAARASQKSFVEGAPAFAERMPSFSEGHAPPDPAPTGPLPNEARASQSNEARGPMRSHPNADPTASLSPQSYPPAPQPLGGAILMGAAAGASRVEIEMPKGPIAPGRLGPSYAEGYAPSADGYSAAPGVAIAEGSSFGEIRTTGALPLVNPKRSITGGTPLVNGEGEPSPGYTPLAPPAGYSNRPPPMSNPPGPMSNPPPAEGTAPKMGEPITVPLSSLFGAGGVVIAMAVMAFFVGRCSVVPGAQAGSVRTALGTIPRLARVALPSPPKPCWMAKQPVRWAPSVLQSVPVDVAPSKDGVTVAYARDEHEPGLVEVNLAAGTFEDKGADKRDGNLLRVFAPREGSQLFATTKGESSPLAPYVYAPGSSPFVLGLAGKGTAESAVAAADKPDATPQTLWTVPAVEDDKGLDAARVIATASSKYALVFRRQGNILAGYIGDGRKAEGTLQVVSGSGGGVGRPSLGSNAREIAIVFGDHASSDAPWEIRMGHAPLGTLPKESQVIPLPKGGPGGEAFAPDVAGMTDGRWVLVWTEGKSGAYAVRAQTFAADWKPLGDPIAISPPAGNFGQAVVGVAGNYVTTMFLSRASGGSYELWGAVLQCGS
ncbi:MAG: GYF domain-containing protein [Polyangiaceae bacterium]